MSPMRYENAYGVNIKVGPQRAVAEAFDSVAELLAGPEEWTKYKKDNGFDFLVKPSELEPVQLTEREAKESGAYTECLQPGSRVKLTKDSSPLLRTSQAAKRGIYPSGDLRFALQINDRHDPNRTISLGVVERAHLKGQKGTRAKQFALVSLGRGDGKLTPRVFQGDEDLMSGKAGKPSLKTKQEKALIQDVHGGADEVVYSIEWKDGDLWVNLDSDGGSGVFLQASPSKSFKKRRNYLRSAATKAGRKMLGKFVTIS